MDAAATPMEVARSGMLDRCELRYNTLKAARVGRAGLDKPVVFGMLSGIAQILEKFT